MKKAMTIDLIMRIARARSGTCGCKLRSSQRELKSICKRADAVVVPTRDMYVYKNPANNIQIGTAVAVKRTSHVGIGVAPVAVLVAWLAIVVPAFGASLVRRDAAATVGYLGARASFIKTAIADTVYPDVRLQHLVREASVGCPKIVTPSPLEPETIEEAHGGTGDRAEVMVSDRNLVVQQVSRAVEDALHQARARAFARFAAAVRRLRWHGAAVEFRVRASLRSEADAQRRTIPKLCREMRLWVGSAFKRVPSGFRTRRPAIVGVDVNGPLPNPRVLLWPGALDAYALLGSLEPLLGGHQQSRIMDIRRLQTKLILDEMRAVRQPTSDILHALGFYSHGTLFAELETHDRKP